MAIDEIGRNPTLSGLGVAGRAPLRKAHRCEVISHCGFACILLTMSDVEHLFIYVLLLLLMLSCFSCVQLCVTP